MAHSLRKAHAAPSSRLITIFRETTYCPRISYECSMRHNQLYTSKLILILVLTIQSASLMSQGLGERSVPTAGTTYIELSCDTTGVQPGEAGSDRVWDFSGLSTNSEPRTIVYQAAALLPQALQLAYPNATVFVQSDSQLFVYGRSDDTYQLLAATTDGSGRFYDRLFPLAVRQVPMPYGLELTSLFQSRTIFAGGAVYSYGGGTTNVSLDGKGVLSLPIVGSRPAYRLRSLITSSDTTTSISGLPEGSRLNEQVDSYQYFDAEDESLLLDITRATLSAVTKNGVPLGPTQFRSSVRVFRKATSSVQYNDPIQGKIAMVVEPGSRISMSGMNGSSVHIQLVDVVGRRTIVAVDDTTSGKELVVPDLIDGFYIVLADTGVLGRILVRSK